MSHHNRILRASFSEHHQASVTAPPRDRSGEGAGGDATLTLICLSMRRETVFGYTFSAWRLHSCDSTLREIVRGGVAMLTCDHCNQCYSTIIPTRCACGVLLLNLALAPWDDAQSRSTPVPHDMSYCDDTMLVSSWPPSSLYMSTYMATNISTYVATYFATPSPYHWRAGTIPAPPPPPALPRDTSTLLRFRFVALTFVALCTLLLGSPPMARWNDAQPPATAPHDVPATLTATATTSVLLDLIGSTGGSRPIVLTRPIAVDTVSRTNGALAPSAR